MWLYLPRQSISSASAPGPAPLTSVSDWHVQALAASCWWRGKHSRSRIWSQRCKRVSWLTRLCGAMPEPLMAGLGAALWMASLAASRVNLIRSPAIDSATATNAICGAMRDVSSFNAALGLPSSKTSRACLAAAVPSASFETFSDLVSRLRSDYSARQRRAQATNATGFSSSQWPTPATDSFRSRSGERREEMGLDQMARNWPTPQARDGDPSCRGADPSRVGDPARHGGYNLDDWAAKFSEQWPTPAADEARQGFQRRPKGMASQQNQQSLTTIAAQWPTPIAANHRSVYASDETHARNTRPLQEFVGRWATPRASDGEKGAPKQSFARGGVPLVSQAMQWMTPRVQVGQYTRDRGDPSQERLTLEGQAILGPIRLDPPTSTPGAPCSSNRGTLNPLFVEWLMGWPPSWTSLALMLPVSSACACLATALCRYKLLMHFELWRLGLPAEGPPAQLALFG